MSDDNSGCCLVTGASSPLGSEVVRLLLERGYEVAAMVRSGSSLKRLADHLDKIHVIEGDLEFPQRAAAELNKLAPQTVFHLAWQGSGRDARDHSSQIDINVTGSLQILAMALDCGASRWVGLGSQAEYGPRDGILREDLTPHPVNAYGLAKLCVGELSLARCKIAGVHGVWLRLLATYGPDDSDGRLIPDLIRSLLNGGKARLSAGTQRWDYLHITDAAQAVLAAAFGQTSGVFNLASGSAWEVRQLAKFLRDEINPGAELEFGAEAPLGLEADVSKLRQATGWRPCISLEEGLRQTIAWYRAERRELAGVVAASGVRSMQC